MSQPAPVIASLAKRREQVERQTAATRRPWTDLGNAQTLIDEHGERLRYVPGLGWHHYDGRRWREDHDGQTHRYADQVAEDMQRRGLELRQAGEDADGELLKHATRSQARGRLEAMVARAEHDERAVARVDDLDADPHALNLANGTLDLRTGELAPHQAEALITRLADVDHDPDAEAPRFERFIAETFGGDLELIEWTQRAIGYSLGGQASEQVLFLAHGAGLNGKTTLLELLARILGDYSRAIDTASLTTAASDRAARSDLVRLRGARFVHGSEIERGAHLAEDLVKRMAGGDRIIGRHLYREEVEFTFTGTLWLAVNDLPQIAGGGHAMWRRIRVVPFAHRVATPDRHLADRLHAERAGVLAWALAGHRAWREHGLGTCAAVEEATRRYRGEQDRAAGFIDERCQLDPHARVPLAELHAAYLEWEDEHGRQAMSKQELTRRLDAAGHTAVRGAKGVAHRTGLRLRRVTQGDGRSETPHETALEKSRNGRHPASPNPVRGPG